MCERVTALRGRFTAQDDPAGGFTVTAHLPVAL
jgi:hypothetical protein